MNRLFIYITIVICIIAIQSCDLDEIKSVATSGEMKIVTDENVELLMKDEVREFQRLNPEAKIIMSSAPTNNVITELLNRDTKFIVSTRALNQEEKVIAEKNKMEITEIPMAIDAIGFIVNTKNPVTRVTSDDLRKILNGETKSWLDIKAQDEEQNKERFNFRRCSLYSLR